jgi:predicted aspartyl protease
MVPSAVEDALAAAGDPVPSAVTVQAIIDTGASSTVVRTGTCRGLGLNPVGVINIHTPSSADVPCEQFSVRIAFPNNVQGTAIVTEAPMPGQGIQALIGRDVLSQAVLVYIGFANTFSLSF